MPFPLIPLIGAAVSGVVSGAVRDQLQQSREEGAQKPEEQQSKKPEIDAGF